MLRSKYTFKTDRIVIALIAAILLLNALRPWLDFLLPINNQLITAVQFLILLLFITVLDSNFYKKTHIPSALLLLSISIIFIIQALFQFFTGDVMGLISGLYVLLRTFLLVYLFQILLTSRRDKQTFISAQNYLVAYFLITFFYCMLQHPQILNVGILREYGSNFTSANPLVTFRANGGIGGTVVDYANFLLAFSWILFFSHFKSKSVRNWLLLIFAITSFLAFSRALYLSLFFILFVHVISFKNIKRTILSFMIIVVPLFLFIINFETIQEFYSDFNASDSQRLESWLLLFKNFTLLEFIVGTGIGGNTGLFLAGEGKISGDGFVTGFTYDAGILTFLLLFSVIISRVLSIRSNWRVKVSIIGSMFLMLVINSGFEKLFIVFSYVLSIAIVYGSNNYFTEVKANVSK
tara:strand:+ start:555 stop:1778 length:1224 start_codon:yes stop_codon:yes gene_type:complete